MLKRRDFKIVKTPAVGNKGRKRKVQKKVKAKKAKLANPMLKNWRDVTEEVSLEVLKRISGCPRENFFLGLHKVDKILGKETGRMAVFTFETKDLRPVHDFIADQYFWKKSEIVLLKVKGYLRKKFSERFGSVNASLTCFATNDGGIIELARNGIIEEKEEQGEERSIMKTY